MERWRDSGGETGGTLQIENVNITSPLDPVELLPIMKKQYGEPTLEDICKAIDGLTCGKTPGRFRVRVRVNGRLFTMKPTIQYVTSIFKRFDIKKT